MIPQIYKEKDEEVVEDKKPVVLRLVPADSGGTKLIGVNKKGGLIVNLLVFEKGGVRAVPAARDCLERGGYDTDFTKWDHNGAMVLG